MTLDSMIQEYILEVLSISDTKKQACLFLDISEKTLRNYLHKWGREDLLEANRRVKDTFYYPNPTFKERERMQNWEGKESEIPQKTVRKVR